MTTREPSQESLLDQGRLICWISELKRDSSGGMRAYSFLTLPLIRMTNINLSPGDWRAEEIIEDTKNGILMTTNKDFKSLPSPEKWNPIEGAYDENTATCTPDHRAEIVKKAIETAHSKSLIVKSAAGYFSTGFLAYCVANSLGISAWARISIGNMKTTVISVSNGSEGFGTAEKYSKNVRDIDLFP